MNNIQNFCISVFIFLINMITKINIYLFPYISIILFNQDILSNITFYYYIYYYFYYLVLPFSLLNDNNCYLFRIHIREQDKYYIYKGTILNLILNRLSINNIDVITQPRNLFIKYKILINGLELNLEDKILFKKYHGNSKLIDVLKFNTIKLNELVIFKNDTEIKKYSSDVDKVMISDICMYL
jgi:hypothetical protein